MRPDPEKRDLVATGESGAASVPRRDFLRLAMALLAGPAVAGCSRGRRPQGVVARRRVLILGFDGLDPHLLTVWIKSGHLPNFARLRERGGLCPLRSTTPPQSPVAWASFITGMDPSGHGIYDFIHRNPTSYGPHLSTSVTHPAAHRVRVGNWVVPLSRGQVELKRRGPALWNVLAAHGVPATVQRIPSNFPPEQTPARTLSGLGTPDVHGSYGRFSYFTTAPPELTDDLSGGAVYPVEVQDGVIEAELEGPENEFRATSRGTAIPFRVYLDTSNPVARVDIQHQRLLLKEGEWSDWVSLTFKLVPGLASCSGLCRFYLKSVRPFALYVSPVNINPADPAMPISTPADYASELQEQIGSFYTQGMAEDTKALSAGIFSDEEFRDQARTVFREQADALQYELDRFDDGLLFSYFSASDLVVHMFWRALDRRHPLWTAKLAREAGDVVKGVYASLDDVLGQATSMVDDNTLVMVLSDHGFAPFRRAFDLNAWLIKNGYLSADLDATPTLETADWAHSRAYAVGFNALYVNQSEREAEGIVSPGPAKERLLEELCAQLAVLRDPVTGERIIHGVHRTAKCYAETPEDAAAPDAILGFCRGYRSSWETAVGDAADDWVADNWGKWSGDHCIDADLVPGVLLCNQAVRAEAPALWDIAPTVLAEYGIAVPSNMTGRPILDKA